MTGEALPNPIVLVILLGALSLAPFVLIMLTSFVKISVVLSILRNAIGAQQVPPNQVITGLAFVLSMFVMVPVATQMYNSAGTISENDSGDDDSALLSMMGKAGVQSVQWRGHVRTLTDSDRALFDPPEGYRQVQ